MTTVAKAISAIQQRLAGAGIATPRLDAQILLSHVLGIDRTRLLAAMPDVLEPVDFAAVTRLADRRLAGESVAYLICRKDFLDFTLDVNPAVLTPRPETELLVEWAIAWLRDKATASVVDVGSGSGAIAIGIAVATEPGVRITAIDCSADALAITRGNAESIAPGRIESRGGDLHDGDVDRYDLVVANLPYLRPEQIDENRDLSAEPRIALDGGAEGLDLISRLISQIPDHFARIGGVALEIDPSQSAKVKSLLAQAIPGATIMVHKDLAGHDRFVTAVRI